MQQRLSSPRLSKLSAAVLTWLRLVQLLRTYQSSDEHRTNVRNSIANCVYDADLMLTLTFGFGFGFCPQRSHGRKRPGQACGIAPAAHGCARRAYGLKAKSRGGCSRRRSVDPAARARARERGPRPSIK